MLTVVAALIGIVVGASRPWRVVADGERLAVRLAEDQRRPLLADAEREAETTRREAQIEAREQAVRLRAEIESEVQDRRARDGQGRGARAQREAEVDVELTRSTRREQGIADREMHTKQLQEELKARARRRCRSSSGSSGLTVAEARQQLLERSEDVVRHELARTVRQLEEEARTDARGRRGRSSPTRCNGWPRATPPRRPSPSSSSRRDDMKGRIIGREGRNIRSLEHLTGVDFIIDDTPHAVVLSSFDGIRREIAKLTLEKLIEDGRIHPARIEEMYYQSKAELEEQIRQAGEQAVFEANCGDVHEELDQDPRSAPVPDELRAERPRAHARGRPPRRDHGGRARPAFATTKRAALLHDLGKAMTHEVEGSHALVSAQLARRYGESDGVVHAIEAHHYEVQPQTVEAVLLIAADAISASRPGARGESLEHYIKRLEALEEIAAAKPGVQKAYALQAGREIRVIVEPSEVDDDGTALLSTRSRGRSRTSSSIRVRSR